mmetsp:Transcript_62765/g.147251  ORF Transcript_62765/g.147251 Transcript_62765/m.147251 type:complete len:258 (+) Transcript_62765:941-1714(+)
MPARAPGYLPATKSTAAAGMRRISVKAVARTLAGRGRDDPAKEMSPMMAVARSLPITTELGRPVLATHFSTTAMPSSMSTRSSSSSPSWMKTSPDSTSRCSACSASAQTTSGGTPGSAVQQRVISARQRSARHWACSLKTDNADLSVLARGSSLPRQRPTFSTSSIDKTTNRAPPPGCCSASSTLRSSSGNSFAPCARTCSHPSILWWLSGVGFIFRTAFGQSAKKHALSSSHTCPGAGPTFNCCRPRFSAKSDLGT